jgi:hypothetical protein
MADESSTSRITQDESEFTGLEVVFAGFEDEAH